MYNATLRQDSFQNGDIFSFSLRLSQILHRNLEHLLLLNSSGGSERTHDSMFHFMASETDHGICCWIDISHSSPSFLPHNYALGTDTNPYAFSSYTDRRRKLRIGGHPAELITAALSLCCHGHVTRDGWSCSSWNTCCWFGPYTDSGCELLQNYRGPRFCCRSASPLTESLPCCGRFSELCSPDADTNRWTRWTG